MLKNKLNQFISNLNGQFVEVSDRNNIYQCMDLIYVWVFALDIPKSTVQRLYAYDVFIKANDLTREYFDVIPNKLETIPQEGDLVVWKGGSAGHIAIIIEATQTRMKVFEQNKPLGTNAHIQDKSYTNVLGFLRPKFAKIDGVPQWIKTLLQERGLTLENEPEIRSIFDKAKKYDDEIKVLNEKVKTANETLADKSLEVSDYVSKNEKLGTKVEELEVLYGNAKTERDDFSYDNERLDAMVEKLEGEAKKLQDTIDTRDSMIKALKSDLVKARKAIIEDIDPWTLVKIIVEAIFKKR